MSVLRSLCFRHSSLPCSTFTNLNLSHLRLPSIRFFSATITNSPISQLNTTESTSKLNSDSTLKTEHELPELHDDARLRLLTPQELAERHRAATEITPKQSKKNFNLNCPKLDSTWSFRFIHTTPEHTQVLLESFEKIANKLDLYPNSLLKLPTKIQRWTLLRSPFVHKTSRVQYEIRRHKRVVKFKPKTLKEERNLLRLINRIYGVGGGTVTVSQTIPANTQVKSIVFLEEQASEQNREQKELKEEETREAEILEKRSHEEIEKLAAQ